MNNYFNENSKFLYCLSGSSTAEVIGVLLYWILFIYCIS